MRIKVTSINDGVYHVETTLKTIIEWERRFKVKASSATLGMEDLAYEMNYESARLAREACDAMTVAIVAISTSGAM